MAAADAVVGGEAIHCGLGGCGPGPAATRPETSSNWLLVRQGFLMLGLKCYQIFIRKTSLSKGMHYVYKVEDII